MHLRHILFLCLVAAAPAAMAAEGVFQISQACVADGCFAGDSPGWPVQIQNPGSYRLVSNLDRSDAAVPADASGIDITENGVTLDLNGFALIGAINCTGSPVTSCTAAPGSGSGIASNSPSTIRNGTVRGFSSGVSCSAGCVVEHILVEHNAGSGISTNNAAALVRDNIARFNGGDGFFVQGRIENNVAEDNGDVGLFMNPRSIGDGNVVRDNGGNGVRCSTCLLTNNMITGNAGFGVDFSNQASWMGNVVFDNDAGTITGTAALQLGPNRCGNVACP